MTETEAKQITARIKLLFRSATATIEKIKTLIDQAVMTVDFSTGRRRRAVRMLRAKSAQLEALRTTTDQELP